MTKMFKISSCSDCIHRKYYSDNHFSICWHTLFGGRIIKMSDIIPTWCPLPDYDKMEDELCQNK